MYATIVTAGFHPQEVTRVLPFPGLISFVVIDVVTLLALPPFFPVSFGETLISVVFLVSDLIPHSALHRKQL